MKLLAVRGRSLGAAFLGGLALLGALLPLALSAPAQAQLTLSQADTLLFRVGERSLDVSLSPQAVSAEGLQLERHPRRLVGSFQGRPVDIAWRDFLVTGRVGDQAVHARFSPRTVQAGSQLEGTFAGHSGRLVLAPSGIAADFGDCAWFLSLAGNRYVGWLTCGATQEPPVPVSLQFPEAWLQAGSVEEAVLLALLLSTSSPG